MWSFSFRLILGEEKAEVDVMDGVMGGPKEEVADELEEREGERSRRSGE